MQFSPVNFYQTDYLTNTLYLIQMVLEKYLSQSLFRNDPSRVIFADTSVVFRERLRRLKEQGFTDLDGLNLPFMSYFYQGNWVLDDRPGFINAKAILEGFSSDDAGQQLLKFMHTKVTFNCVCYYNTFLDAQLGYETLLWLDKPAAQQFAVGSVTYKGYQFDIPLNMSIENLSFNPDVKEKEYFSSRKIIPIKFDIVMRSISFSQMPQPEGSLIFSSDSAPVITKQVMLDFLAYKGSNKNIDTSHVVLEVMNSLVPSTDITPVLTVGTVTESTITVNWYVDPNAIASTESSALLTINTTNDVSVERSLGTYTFTNLSPQSTYSIVLWVYGTDGRVQKASVDATTLASISPLILKGIRGY